MSLDRNIYPSEILNNPGKPYVYFDSLPNFVIDRVASYFSQDIKTITTTDTGLTAIDQAFSFLESVITVERAKEEAFVAYLKDKTKDTFNLQIPNINSDWSDFVKEIQTLIDFGNNGLTSLKNEYKRLQKNKESLEQAQAEGRDQGWYQQDALSKTSKWLQAMVKDFREKTYKANKISSIVLEVILDRYKDSLIIIENGKLAFNRGELAALILSITQIVLDIYNVNTYIPESGKQRQMSKEELNKLLDSSDVDEQVRAFIQKFYNIPSFRQDIITTYNLQSTNRDSKLNAQDLVDSHGEILEDSRSLAEAIKTKLQNYRFPEKAIKLISKPNALAEIDSLLKFAINGALKVSNTGSAGAKPDNILGFITIDPAGLEIFNESERNKIIDGINAIIEKIDKLVKSLSKSNTTEYYQNQAKLWKAICDDIDKILYSLKDIYGFLPSCFVIEDSTKNYLSLYARLEDGKASDGVHGGSLGASLTDQLNKIDALTQAGGITMIDKAWLTAAIINAGPNMVAHNQKEKIENYLSMFAAILLFDGQINIAEEAMHYMVKEKLSSSSTHQLHLFSVNGGYYPLSYVLRLTYTSLTKGLERIKNIELSEGVQTEIFGFVSKPDNNNYSGLESWSSLAEKAKKSTKIKMKFLVQFQNIISNLLQLN